MTWEETIKYIRTQSEFFSLVENAYFEEDLSLNVERFRESPEFKETLALIEKYQPNGKKILDIGCGNGISCIAFALLGFEVTAVEPDPSDTIGAGAIRILKDHYQLNNISIYESYAEEIDFDSESFDIVYVRQAMHHANNLNNFVSESSRVLKKGGCLLTIRDHVIFNDTDKEKFLKCHPLHKFYGGENGYTPNEYKKAMELSNLEVILELKYYDSIINYFPLTREFVGNMYNLEKTKLKTHLETKIGLLAKIPFVFNIYAKLIGFNRSKVYDESNVPGRMYTYVSYKK